MTEKRIVYITDVCSSIFAGGDAPKKHFSFEQTEECCYPVFSNGESHNGLYGYTNTARVTEPSITVSARGTIGFTAIRLTPFTPIVRLISITPIQDIIDIDYLYYALSNYTLENTGTSIPQLTVPMIKKYKFRLPEKDEQKRAVKTLKQLDDILEKGKIQIQKLDELVKSRFVEMFGSTDKSIFSKMPMNEICNIVDGDRGKNYPKQNEFFENGYCLFLNAKNITSKGFDFSQRMYITKEKDAILRKGKLKRGDVVLTTRGTIGNLAFYSDDIPIDNMRINSGMVILRMKKDLVNEVFFIEHFKMSLKDILEKIASGTAQPQLPINTMNKIMIITPPIDLQNQFADFVTKVEKQKTTVQKSIEKLETLKKSLMQEYFG